MDSDKKILISPETKDLDPISFFEKDENFVLVYKKTEKLVSAVYMVTNLFPINEPIKWTLRKGSSDLMSFIITYKDTPSVNHPDFVYNLKTRVLEIVAFLQVSLRGGLVSQMNFFILKQEFLSLTDTLDVLSSAPKDVFDETISKKFFDMADEDYFALRDTSEGKNYNTSSSLGVIQKMSFSNVRDKGSATKDDLKRSNRQNAILSLLKKRKEMTVKDISQVIKDCSEKTLQRELNSFISNGVLKRSGVRRWSKYSLV